MNDFQKALLQAVNEEFSDVPAENELDIPALRTKKYCSHALRRGLLIAAAAIALIGGVVAAYVLKHPIGEVEVETDEIEIFGFELPEDDRNHYFQLTFNEVAVNPDAPQKLETYFLPLKFVDAQSLHGWNCHITEYDNMLGYYPFRDEQPSFETELTDELLDLVLTDTDEAHYSWETEQYGYIYFTQTRVIQAADGTPFVNHVLPDSGEQTVNYRTLEIGEYSVFAFEISFDFSDEISRTWYWTDGDYIFSLCASLSEAEMVELMQSVAPVSTVYPYKELSSDGIEAEYEEIFNLIP